MHTYDFHIGDYARDTLHLSLLEHGVYRLLLDRAYLDEAPLPNDVPKLCRRLNARTAAEQKAVESVLAEFFTLTPEGYTHKRVIEEMGDARLRSQKSKFAQVLNWWRKRKWENEPTLEIYLENPAAFHDPYTGHIRNPYASDTPATARDTTVCERITPEEIRNTYQPPTANRQPPTAIESYLPPKAPQGGQHDRVAGAQVDLLASAKPALTPAKKKRGAARMTEPVFPVDLPAGYHAPLCEWFRYKQQVGKGYVPDGWAKLITQQRRFSPGQVTASVEASMANGWAGLFTDRVVAEQQKKGGAAPASEPLQIEKRRLLTPPDGYERALEALYGDEWKSFLPDWANLTPSDRAQVKEWLAKNPEPVTAA